MRIVIKVGTSVLTGGTKRLHRAVMVELASQIGRLRTLGHQVILVSSGAIAAGREVLAAHRAAHLAAEPIRAVVELPSKPHEKNRPENLVDKQVLAAAGQVRLMAVWQSLLEIYHIHVGQMLLTRADLENRGRFLNARDTLLGLLAADILPIINENDAVATAEIKVGDNDNLSARVALLANADILMLLTDQPGLMSANPTQDASAQLLSEITTIDASLLSIAGGSVSGLGTGGMTTKLQAAQTVRQSGVEVIIAGIKQPDVLLRLIDGSGVGTRIRPSGSRLEGRKRWLLSGPQSPGQLHLDAGASQAIRIGKKSLLAKGIVRSEGLFHRGDAVRLVDPTGTAIGIGLARYDSGDLHQILGRHSDEIAAILGYSVGGVVVHRDELIAYE